MKRFILLMMICLPLTAMAQDGSFARFMERYSSRQNCTTLELSTEMLKSMGVESGISTMWAISVEAAELVGEFERDVESILSNYTPLMSVNSSGEVVKIYSRQKDGKIVDIIINCVSKDEGVVIRIVGEDISLNEATSLMSLE